jgi:D-serine deaminase-like pyridoxal phosphate-dependent protein
MNAFDLDTPCLVLDLDLLDINMQKMQTIARSAGKELRPHAKSHKCSALAKRQLEKGAKGVCVAKVSEAEVLVKKGIHDVLVTGAAAVAQKAARLVNLLEVSSSLMTVIDHPGNIDLLENELEKKNLRMDVLVDIDIGLKRTGVPPVKAPELADRIMASNHLRLRGIQAYAGHVQHIHGYGERTDASIKSLNQAVGVFQKLREMNPACTIFSGTGTGTADIDLAVPELTELQVGSYVLMDAEYGAIESRDAGNLSSNFHPALKLLTTVVNTAHDTQVTVDAGLKTLYKDGGRPQVATPAFVELQYDWFGDEYGKLSPQKETAVLPPLGTVLELIVSHCDPTVNQFDCYRIIQKGKVIDQWPIDLRGKSQ